MYEFDKAVVAEDGIALDNRLQGFVIHENAVPVSVRISWPGALLFLRRRGGPLLEVLAEDGGAGTFEFRSDLENGEPEIR
jgi:hypothetical protein